MAEIIMETVSYQDCTLGRLWCQDFQCFTLELPWRNNQDDVSCIPAGEYEYFYRISGRNGKVLELVNVESREHIQFHAGNYHFQILGCILPGRSIKFLDADTVPDVTSSGPSMEQLLLRAGKEGKLTIKRAFLDGEHSQD